MAAEIIDGGTLEQATTVVHEAGVGIIATDACLAGQKERGRWGNGEVVDGILVQAMVVYTYPSLVRLEAKGLFPKRSCLGKKRYVWALTDVYAWMQDKLDERSGGSSRDQIIQIGDRFIEISEVRSIASVSRAHIYRLESAGAFPRRISLGRNRAAWLEREVREWGRSQEANRRLSN